MKSANREMLTLVSLKNGVKIFEVENRNKLQNKVTYYDVTNRVTNPVKKVKHRFKNPKNMIKI